MALKNGADELDVSMNVGKFLAGDHQAVLTEMRAVTEAAKGFKKSVVVKYIIETGFLNDAEIKKASELVLRSGADFVKTCTGFAGGGATAADLSLMRRVVGPDMGVKASGGIRNYDKAVEVLNAGANRIGAVSSVPIVTGVRAEGKGY